MDKELAEKIYNLVTEPPCKQCRWWFKDGDRCDRVYLLDSLNYFKTNELLSFKREELQIDSCSLIIQIMQVCNK